VAIYIEMPKFGLSMEEGTITSWFKAEGDPVKQGDTLAEVVTEKITNIIEAPADGVLRKILVGVDETVPCGSPVGIIASAQEDISDLLAESNEKIVPLHRVETDKVEESIEKETIEVKITPKAKVYAEERGIDYSQVIGTGIGGAITLNDLKKISQVNTKEVKLLSEIRKIIAKRMMESLTNSAQASMSMDVDVSSLVALYEKLKPEYMEEGIKLSYTAFILKAVAIALKKHPVICTQLGPSNDLKIKEEINIGVAVDIEDGLIVPVICNVDKKDLKTICRELKDLSFRARQNQLTVDEMTGGVITVSNLGMFGIKYFTPILNLPENCILGIGAISEQVAVENGGIHIKHVLNMSLTHDHRLVDGAPAARFLKELSSLLGQPEILIQR
jgi:pyruvate dehydrogenase E2 component (dihydrolipoamide acetyltransferase)